MSEERPKLTPEHINRDILPEQQAYKVDIDETGSFDLNTLKSHPVIFTNEIKMYMMEGDPGDGIEWHTHAPDMDQINVCLEGQAQYTLERDEDDYQDLVIEPGQLVYLPGGARHKMEVVGDEYHKELSIYKSIHVARLEMLEPDFEVYDMDTWPIGLWVDRERDEVVTKDENAVSE